MSDDKCWRSSLSHHSAASSFREVSRKLNASHCRVSCAYSFSLRVRGLPRVRPRSTSPCASRYGLRYVLVRQSLGTCHIEVNTYVRGEGDGEFVRECAELHVTWKYQAAPQTWEGCCGCVLRGRWTFGWQQHLPNSLARRSRTRSTALVVETKYRALPAPQACAWAMTPRSP